MLGQSKYNNALGGGGIVTPPFIGPLPNDEEGPKPAAKVTFDERMDVERKEMLHQSIYNVSRKKEPISNREGFGRFLLKEQIEKENKLRSRLFYEKGEK